MENQDAFPPDTTTLPPNGHPKTVMLSTNSTLFWRVFIPVFGTVFLSGFLLAFWLVDEDDLSLPFSMLWPRLLLLAIVIGWLWFLQRTLWRLKRVDADDTHIYVTNYWTTVRYPWHDIERIEEKKRFNRRVVNFWLRAPGKFGQVISFLPGSFFDEWMKSRF
ncbi:MAG: hypothetical protein DYG98_05900 [Haliscomenobacteraceae bacterium CHB4]|nr:hypothetical protein [Haliscomenobacteraceae bacterium CHB4]